MICDRCGGSGRVEVFAGFTNRGRPRSRLLACSNCGGSGSLMESNQLSEGSVRMANNGGYQVLPFRTEYYGPDEGIAHSYFDDPEALSAAE
jgi:hypothetical protein